MPYKGAQVEDCPPLVGIYNVRDVIWGWTDLVNINNALTYLKESTTLYCQRILDRVGMFPTLTNTHVVNVPKRQLQAQFCQLVISPHVT